MSSYPFTIAAWTYPSNGGIVASLGTVSGIDRHLMALSTATTKFDIQSNVGGSVGTATSSANFTTNQWTHVCGVFNSTTDRSAYLNGVLDGTNSTNVSFGSITRFYIGTRIFTTAGGFFNGSIAEVGIWNAALTAAEIASLADGITCDKVRPQSLVFYTPLVRNLQDLRGGLTITNNNTATVAVHPRVYT